MWLYLFDLENVTVYWPRCFAVIDSSPCLRNMGLGVYNVNLLIEDETLLDVKPEKLYFAQGPMHLGSNNGQIDLNSIADSLKEDLVIHPYISNYEQEVYYSYINKQPVTTQNYVITTVETVIFDDYLFIVLADFSWLS